MSEIAERYRTRADNFERKVAAVRDDQWDNQSPCAEWLARDVLRHVVDMHGVLLRQTGHNPPTSPSHFTAPSVDEDPLAAFRSARADVQAVLDDPVAAAVEFEAPHAGRTTAEQSIDGVISADLVLHGWDLAKATGQDATIPADEIERGTTAAASLPEEVLRLPGVFGPAVTVAEDASPQDKLLAFIGRDPNWGA